MATGTPASGSSRRSARDASARASSRTPSGRRTWKAWTLPSSVSIHSRCASTMSRGLARPSRTAAASSIAVRPTSGSVAVPAMAPPRGSPGIATVRGGAMLAPGRPRVKNRPCGGERVGWGGEGKSARGPGDQAELGGTDQALVAWDHAHGVAEGPGCHQGDLALEDPAAVLAVAVLLERKHVHPAQLVGVVDPPAGDLDLDLLRLEVAQFHHGPHGEAGAQRRLPLAAGDPADHHARPGRRHPLLPYRQLAPAGEASLLEPPGPVRCRQVVVLGVLPDHAGGQHHRPEGDQVVLD